MKCSICGQKELILNTYQIFQGQKTCPDCVREQTLKCGVCGRLSPPQTRTRALNEINPGGWSLIKLNDNPVNVCPGHPISKCPRCDDPVVQGYNTHVSDNTCDECAPFTHRQDFITKKFFHKDSMTLVHRPNDYDVWVYPKSSLPSFTLQRCAHCNELWLFTHAEWEDHVRAWPDIPQFTCGTCAKSMKPCSCCGDMYVSRPAYRIIYDEDFPADSEVLESTQAYCPSCMQEAVRGYHSNQAEDLTFHDLGRSVTRTFGDDAPTHKVYLGMELEVDTSDPDITPEQVRAAAMRVREYLGPSFLSVTRDGSLTNGFEMITAPMTLEYIHSHWGDLKQMCLIPKKFGLRSHDAGTCGMHVHISREPLVEANRLEQLVTWFWPELVVFSRRVKFSYCNPAWDHVTSISIRDLYSMDVEEDHYRAVNGEHSQTVELRLWRGSLKPETVLATLEMSQYLADLCCVTATKYRSIIEGGWDAFVQNIPKDQFPNLVAYLGHIEPKIKSAQRHFSRSASGMSYNWSSHMAKLPEVVETVTKF